MSLVGREKMRGVEEWLLFNEKKSTVAHFSPLACRINKLDQVFLCKRTVPFLNGHCRAAPIGQEMFVATTVTFVTIDSPTLGPCVDLAGIQYVFIDP